jgi:CheY-like chemotaxis protein
MATNPATPFVVRNALVVDADPELKPLLNSVLEPGAWAIHYVMTNREALASVTHRSYELIVTDEKTSGMEDLDLLRKIRVKRPHTRMIILANESTPQEVIACMREHAFSYFTLPFSADALADMIRLAIDAPCWDDGIEIEMATPEWIRLQVRCEIKTADRLIQFLREIAELPDNERVQVGTAFREMLMNAMEHGGHLDPEKHVKIEYVRARRMVACTITDPGPGFTLDEIPHAAIANPDDEPVKHIQLREEMGMRPGGFGIMLAQKLVDQLIYSQHGNEVMLVKYLPDPEQTTVVSAAS